MNIIKFLFTPRFSFMDWVCVFVIVTLMVSTSFWYFLLVIPLSVITALIEADVLNTDNVEQYN